MKENARRELRMALNVRGGRMIEYVVDQPVDESDDSYEQRAITVLAAMLERSKRS